MKHILFLVKRQLSIHMTFKTSRHAKYCEKRKSTIQYSTQTIHYFSCLKVLNGVRFSDSLKWNYFPGSNNRWRLTRVLFLRKALEAHSLLWNASTSEQILPGAESQGWEFSNFDIFWKLSITYSQYFAKIKVLLVRVLETYI